MCAVSAAWIPKATIQAAIASIPLDYLTDLWGLNPADETRQYWIENVRPPSTVGPWA